MPLTSKITKYDENWPDLFAKEKDLLQPVFAGSCVAIHHVGSTAVAGLAAKPEIDILIVVSDTSAMDKWQGDVLALGYRRGGDVMPGHHFFKRDEGETRTHKLHICRDGHSQINRMLGIRDHLRRNSKDRDAYAALKLSLEEENQLGIAEYLQGKAPFLDALYRRIVGGADPVEGG